MKINSLDSITMNNSILEMAIINKNKLKSIYSRKNPESQK